MGNPHSVRGRDTFKSPMMRIGWIDAEGTSMTDALLWHRIQFAFTITYPLPVPAADDGAGAAHRGVQVARPVAPRRVVQRGRPVLGRGSSPSTSPWAW